MSTDAALAEALAKFQAALPTVHKSETATVKTKTGGEYKYRYADLAMVSAKVLPLLGAVGLSFTASPTLTDGRFVLAYRLMHSSGGSVDGEYPLPTSGTPQEIGSAITYARRYALCSVTGVAPDEDDDDAQAAEVASRSRRRRREAEPEKQEQPRDWDPIEQESLFDGWAAEIAKAATDEEMVAIGKRLLVAKRSGDSISPMTYAKLATLGGQRKAELNGAQHDQA